jgi:DNA topoisomerase I
VLNISLAGRAAFLLRSPDMRQTWLSRRGRKPGHFIYVTSRAKAVSARRAAQIDALAIPPGWTDVHVAASGRSAIQAWGFDARGRKQYRYHPDAVKRGQRRKHYRVRQMARDLPDIRRRVYADFDRRGMSREKVCAAIVRFLADGFFRIGNDRYAKENGTFGLTTLRKSHVTVDGDLIVFDYVGKRAIRHRQTVVSRDLARFVESLQKAPGSRLFRYQDDDGEWHNVESAQVNQYLQAISGFPYSAKDFRTWGGTLRAATVLADLGPARSAREAQRNVATAVRLVAAELGNTPTICRKSYVHPVVIERYLEAGDTIQPQPVHAPKSAARSGGRSRPGLPRGAHTPEERALIQFLDDHFPERRRQRRTKSV